MFKNKASVLSSLFSILISSTGLIVLNQTFSQAKKLDKEIEDLINAPEIINSLPPLTIVVPARNEESNIKDCLDSILKQNYPKFEIIAVDDNSNDHTPAILEKLVLDHQNHLKLVKINIVGEGWLGKQNALWQGYKEVDNATEWVLFLDADVKLQPNALKGTVAFAQANSLDLLSMAPGLEEKNSSFWHKVMSGELAKLYTLAYINPLKPAKKGSIEEASAIGTFILVRKNAYEAVGGHKAVKNSIIEDIMLARIFRKEGYKTSQILGFNFLKTKGYRTFVEIWDGITKNFFTVAHKNWLIVGWLVGVEFLSVILPTWHLLSSTFLGSKKIKSNKVPISLNLLAVILLYLSSNELNRHYKINWTYGFLFPLSGILSSLMLVVSAIKSQFFKSVRWKGRKIDLT